MAVRVSGLVRRAQRILQYALGTRWDELELLDWFNDGRRELAVIKPAEFAVRLPVELVTGALQQLPAQAFQLLRVDCNLLSVTPRVPGRALSIVERRVMKGDVVMRDDFEGNSLTQRERAHKRHLRHELAHRADADHCARLLAQ